MKFRNKKRKLNHKVFPFKIKCTCCATFYSNPYNSDQGDKCASYIYYSVENGYLIQSEYGSGFDTTRFFIKNINIVKKKHLIAKNNKQITKDDRNIVVCDHCIRKYLKYKFIEIDESYDAFAGINELNSFYAEDPQKYYEIMSNAGPNDCIRLIREERAKPIEQREEERKNRKVINLIRVTDSIFD